MSDAHEPAYGAGARVDLRALEDAARRVGLGEVRADVFEHDPRRGAWFRFDAGRLGVSDLVIDRCRPADAAALLVDDVLRRRAARKLHLGMGAGALALLVGLGLAWDAPSVLVPIGLGALLMAWLVAWVVGGAMCSIRADDRAVALLGDAEALVRGFNSIDQDEVHLAGRRVSARPDLHRRAERLVARHGLCSTAAPGGEGPADEAHADLGRARQTHTDVRRG